MKQIPLEVVPAFLLVCALALSGPIQAQLPLATRAPTPTSRAIAGPWYSSRGPVTFELGGAGYIGTITTPSGGRVRLSGFFIAGVVMTRTYTWVK